MPQFEFAPVIFYWIHVLCDASSGPCSRKYIPYSYSLRKNIGKSATYHPRKTVNALKYPLFGACAACKDERTFDKDMIACPGCNVARLEFVMANG